MRVGESEKEVFGLFHDGRRAGEDGIGVFQIRRGIDAAADFAGIAILVFGAAFRTFALDVTVRQEHLLDRIEELFDRAGGDQTLGLETAIDFAGQFMVFRAVGRVPVVETDQKAV